MSKKELIKIAETVAKLVKPEQFDVFGNTFLNPEALDFLVKKFKRNSNLTYRDAMFILKQSQKIKYGDELIQFNYSRYSKDFYENLSQTLFREKNIISCLEISGSEGDFIESFVKKLPKVELTSIIDDNPLWQTAARNGLANSGSAIISSLDELNSKQQFDVIWDFAGFYGGIADTLETLTGFSSFLSNDGLLLLHLCSEPEQSFIHECNRKSDLKLSGIIQINDPSEEWPTYALIFSKYFHSEIFVAEYNSEISAQLIVKNFLNKHSDSVKRGKMIAVRSYFSFEQMRAEEELAALGNELDFTKVKLGDLLKQDFLKVPEQENTIFLTRTRNLFEKIGIDLNKANGRIEHLDLSKYNIYMDDFYLPGIKTQYLDPGVLEDESFKSTLLADYEYYRDMLGELDIQETFKRQIIRVPLDPAKINHKYFVSLMSKPIGKLLLEILYSFIEHDNGKLDLKKVTDIDMYIEPIEIQNKKARLIEQLDGSIKQLQLISESLEEEKFQEKLKAALSSLQKEFAPAELNKESLDLLVKDYFADPKIYASISKFDAESNKELLERFPNDSRIENIGTVMDFLRTGEWVWKR